MKSRMHQKIAAVPLALLFVVVLLGVWPRPVAAADTPARKQLETSSTGFHPLDLWAAGVLSGDKSSLKRLYAPGVQSVAQTPQGTTQNAAEEESAFWAGLPSRGLSSFAPKILQQTMPQQGVTQLVLRVEMSFQTGSQTKKALVVARQTWARKGNDWLITETRRSDAGELPVITLPQPKVPNTHLYADPNQTRLELVAAISAAKTDHKRVLVIFGANWCYDCHVLDTTLRSKDVAPLVATNYHVVHINIGDGESNSDLADRFQVPLKKGIPSLAVLDDGGLLITSQKQGEFESAAKIGMGDVLGFLNRWKAGR
jgi:hypothetical protein